MESTTCAPLPCLSSKLAPFPEVLFKTVFQNRNLKRTKPSACEWQLTHEGQQFWGKEAAFGEPPPHLFAEGKNKVTWAPFKWKMNWTHSFESTTLPSARLSASSSAFWSISQSEPYPACHSSSSLGCTHYGLPLSLNLPNSESNPHHEREPSIAQGLKTWTLEPYYLGSNPSYFTSLFLRLLTYKVEIKL